MKSFVINRNSYHYLLATRGGFEEANCWGNPYEYDFCQYSRKVLKGALNSLIVLALISALAFGVVHILMGIGFSLFYGMFVFSDLAKFTSALILGITGGVGVLYLCITTREKLDQHREKIRKGNSQPGFIIQTINSWKDRYCLRVEFEGEKKK